MILQTDQQSVYMCVCVLNVSVDVQIQIQIQMKLICFSCRVSFLFFFFFLFLIFIVFFLSGSFSVLLKVEGEELNWLFIHGSMENTSSLYIIIGVFLLLLNSIIFIH